MNEQGLVIWDRPDEVLESRAKRAGLGVTLVPDLAAVTLVYEKSLIVRAQTRVPWDLLPAAWHFLESWDAAVPLWRYGVLAADVGTAAEQKKTQQVIRDLRVLLHSVELLFVRRTAAGSALLAQWQAELGGDLRLAFLRALYQVKPRLCVLPTTWLAEVRQWQGHVVPSTTRRPMQGKPLVTVEIAPGQMVKCHAGDEERVRTMMQAQAGPRSETMAVISNKSFVTENQRTRATKGPLVRVEINPGQFSKMYEADAIAQGLIKPRPTAENKLRLPDENKATDAESDEAVDFTEIEGVGPATARMLVAQQITTHAALRDAAKNDRLTFLSAQPRQAIEAWAEG